MKTFCAFLITVFTTGIVQARTISISVYNELNYSVVAFPHISVNNSSHYLGDAQGKVRFEVDSNSVRIEVFSFQYNTKVIDLEPGNFDLELPVTLIISRLYTPEDLSSQQALGIIKRTQSNAKRNSFLNEKNKTYKLYTKFTISTEKPDLINRSILKTLNFFGLRAINLFSKDQHFYVMETESMLHIKNKVKRKERYTHTRSSGIAIPLVFSKTAHVFIPDPYQNFIPIGNKEFLSPLAKNALKKYAYAIVDSLNIEGVLYWTIKFVPKQSSNFNALYGLMNISAVDYSVKQMVFYPAWDIKSFKEFCLSYKGDHTLDNYTTRTSDGSPLHSKQKNILVESSTNLYQEDLNNRIKYNEYVVEINDEVLYPQEETSSTINRPYPLTAADSLTYEYYEHVKYARILQQILSIGENFYYGYIPLGKMDLETNKLINVNDVEGIRVGIGGISNDNFSKHWELKGFVAMGLVDQKPKYGLGVAYKLHRELEWKVGTEYTYQLTEAGAYDTYFSRPVFSAERLRKYQLKIMDYNSTLSLYTTIHPFQNLDLHLAKEWSELTPSYVYVFNGEYLRSMNFNTLKASVRFAPFEKWIKLSNKKISLGSKFPVLYTGISQSYRSGLFNGGYDYFKWDLRIDQRLKILALGITNIQFVAGATNGVAPYTALFNGRGSLKSPSVVMHNSFETMDYNEFLSDRYWALFISHNVGRLYYKSKLFRPSVTLAYNTGSGYLSNPERHAGINFKTMEKRYSEAGFFLNDILSVKLSGVKIGLGGGLFLRLGDYQYKVFEKNLVWKFALNFGM